MHLFPPPLDIDAKEGFESDKDIFGRAELGAGLTNVVTSVDDALVIALDGQWGAGKTTFLRMWAGELRKKGIPVVWIDAFENDYFEDAFLAIAGEVIALTKEKRKEKTPRGKKVAQTALKVGKVLLKSGAKVGVKVLTIGAADGTEFEDAAKEIAKEASQITDRYLESVLCVHSSQKQTMQEFRDALADLPSLLSDGTEGDEAKPLVFILDELDRCRPDFALQILERIKHFFSVPNVHFVLGVNLDQLENSVVAAYGGGIDARAYLQKFIRLTFPLVDRQNFPHERTVRRFLEHLQKAIGFKDEDQSQANLAIEFIEYVAEKRSLSLRAVELIMANLALAFAYTDERSLRIPPIMAGLCIMKVVNQSLFQRVKQGKVSFEEVDSVLSLSDANEEDDIEWHRKWWEFCTDEAMDADTVKELWRGLSRFHIRDRFEVPKIIANGVVDRLIERSSS